MSNFYFSEDDGAMDRNSVGVLFVIQDHIPGVLLYCDEYDMFWRSMNGRQLDNPIQIKKRSLRPATLPEIQSANLLDVVDGVAGDRVSLKVSQQN